MKSGFYPKLAYDGIRKNKRLYIPYILTCVGMVMMFYIVAFLQKSKTVSMTGGGHGVQLVLSFGTIVIAIFSCIFLFYTNSFLMKKRKKEFGLYNILGMGKRNIGRILLWESLIISFFSLLVGLGAGISLSKLAELGLINLLKGSVTFSLSVSPEAIIMTVAVFCAIFLLLLLNSLRQIRFSNTASLLKSESFGEKPPKGNIILGIIGAILLIGAYWLAVSIKNPISAMMLFFIAVTMVILGTYLVFIAGSVSLCRLLQKKKDYYYKPSHFVSVSSMAFRMKRNGAGLASVCILATMVLVMISSTASLYFGAEDAINARYPREINISVRFLSNEYATAENAEAVRKAIEETVTDNGAEMKNVILYRRADVTALRRGTDMITDREETDSAMSATGEGLYQLYIVPLSDYNAMTGANETLSDREVIVSEFRDTDKYDATTIGFNGNPPYTVKAAEHREIGNSNAAISAFSCLTIISANPDALISDLQTADGDLDPHRCEIDFDTGLDADGQEKVISILSASNALTNIKETCHLGSFFIEGRETNRDDFYGTYGGLLYLGAILSAVFISSAVLIIYYKQITEGYEDRARFDIMQKVGMTKKEIRKSINSQLLTVFFMPLIFAAIHLAFAFPMVKKLLALFNLQNTALFAAVTVGTFIIYALFYTLIYKITSNAYCKIVSNAKQA